MQPQADPYIVPPCHAPLRLLYEDAHLLFVDKPTLLLSIPGRHPANRDCVITRLHATHPTAKIVHRLDLDTSGVMAVPLGDDAHRAISRQFQQRAVHKTYEAVVNGLLADDHGTIDLPLKPDWERRPLQKVDHERGKAAITHYRVLHRYTETGTTRLRLTPETGRSHQLRLHLQAIGHPILGCDLYADDDAFRKADRLLLHATRLALTHPVTGASLAVDSPVPF